MPNTTIQLDVARSLLTHAGREVRIDSRLGAVFLAALWTTSVQGVALTCNVWQLHLKGQRLKEPDRTGMRRLLAQLEACFDALGWPGPRPVVQAPARGATVGPWRLGAELCADLAVLRPKPDAQASSGGGGEGGDSGEGAAPGAVSGHTLRGPCLVLPPPGADAAQRLAFGLSQSLAVLDCFLIADDLARNGLFVDAATSMAEALALPGLSPELQCVVHLRLARFLGRAGRFAHCQASLAAVAQLQPLLEPPMREHVLAEWAIAGWRLRYDDVAHPGQYPEFGASPAAVATVATLTDAHLMAKLLNLQASVWRRRMGEGNSVLSQQAFDNSLRHTMAAIYWALVCGDAFNVMNFASNLGFLLQQSGQYQLTNHDLSALNWLMLSQRYINRFEWQDESLWDHVFLAELYLGSPSVREALALQRPFLMNALTPDTEAFYQQALKVGERLAEPRQLASMYKLYVRFLEQTGQAKKAAAERRKCEALMAQHPGLREKLVRETDASASLLQVPSPTKPAAKPG